jgi:hypothetical protein
MALRWKELRNTALSTAAYKSVSHQKACCVVNGWIPYLLCGPNWLALPRRAQLMHHCDSTRVATTSAQHSTGANLDLS